MTRAQGTYTMYIYWPDGTYCDAEDLADYLTFMSDDYERITEAEINNRIAATARCGKRSEEAASLG